MFLSSEMPGVARIRQKKWVGMEMIHTQTNTLVVEPHLSTRKQPSLRRRDDDDHSASANRGAEPVTR